MRSPQAARADVPEESKGATWLKRKYLDSFISASDFEVGAEAMADTDPSVKKWLPKKRSAGGQHAMNAVNKKLAKETNMPELYVAKTSIWDATKGQVVDSVLHFLLPFEILFQLLAVAPGGVKDLSDVSGKPHLEARRDAWHAKTKAPPSDDVISMSFWGDTAPFNTRGGLFLGLWSMDSASIFH